MCVYERNRYVNAQKKTLTDTYQIDIHKLCTVFKATEEKVIWDKENLVKGKKPHPQRTYHALYSVFTSEISFHAFSC